MANIERKLGMFTSLEGIDFTGKTPIANWLKEDLERQGLKVNITRDPPYKLSPWDRFKRHFEKGEGLSYISEAFLLLTARLDNYEKFILPKLQTGAVVIADRFLDSWFAYQSVRLAKYFGDEEPALEFLMRLNQGLVDRGLLSFPNLTLLIEANPTETMQRAKEVKTLSKYEVMDTQVKVALQYQRLVELFPERIRVVDARGKEISEVYQDAKKIVLEEVTRHYDH
ncbi:MAG: dTMP kinase [Patescibacteria group bacterium]